MHQSLTFLSAALLCAATTTSVACEISSGPQSMALVELYTSEGCSSCPPADRWLSGFSKAYNGKAVVLAFHVDYWDYLGWRDRFDSPRYSQRQHDLVTAAGGRTVYTPQLMIDGADRASWNDSRSIADAVSTVNSRRPGATLTLKLDASTGKSWRVELTGSIQQPNAKQQIWLAVYEDGLSSDVHAGENSGNRLTHDRVVRGWYGPFRAGKGGGISVQQEIPAETVTNPLRAGIASFVQDTAPSRILQAISLPFCPHS